MKNISIITDEIIDGLLVEMKLCNRHVIRTSTIRNRVTDYLLLDYGNNDTKDLVNMGITQLIQQRLYAKGFRSCDAKSAEPSDEGTKRDGYFTSLKDCKNVEYLARMYRNQATTVKEKQQICEIIKSMHDGVLGQLYFEIDGAQVVGINTTPLSEEEFYKMLHNDSI